jgi:hypothetical protein
MDQDHTEVLVEGHQVFTGEVLTYARDPQQPAYENNLLRSNVPATVFLRVARDMYGDVKTLSDSAAAIISTTSMPASGWRPYTETILGTYPEDPLATKPTGSEVKLSEDTTLRAAAICRLASDVAVGPYSVMPVEEAANFLLIALETAGSVCGDHELAFYMLDENIRRLEHYYLARIIQAESNNQNSLADMPARVAIAMRLRGVLIKAGLQTEDHLPNLPEGYFGAGKPGQVAAAQLRAAIAETAGVRP